MKLIHLSSVAVLSVAVLVFLLPRTRLPAQGELDPSIANGALDEANNPQPAMKTLNQVEPRIAINSTNTPGTPGSTYVILNPGSYYLTENLAGEPGKFGLEVHSSHVSIDLMGFSMIGGSSDIPNSEPGILVQGADTTGVSIQNGTLVHWGDGIVSEGSNLTVRNLKFTENGQDGLRAGAFSEVQNCHLRDNGGEGIDLGPSSRVTGAQATGNNYGIVVGATSLVQDCVAHDNTNHGIRLSGAGSRVQSCVTSKNNIGISLDGNGCTAVGNNSSENISAGIASGVLGITQYSDCVIDGNHVTKNGIRGIIITGTDNLIVRNFSQDNPSAYVILTNNQIGTIVSGIEFVGVNGSSGGNLDAIVGPWSNFAR